MAGGWRLVVAAAKKGCSREGVRGFVKHTGPIEGGGMAMKG